MQDAEPKKLAPTVELCNPTFELSGLELSKIGDINLDDTITTMLERLYPIEAVYGGTKDRSEAYDPIIHAQICRFAILGLSEATIARAVGITPATLGRWLQKYPKLNSDVYRAQSASVTDAVLRLRKMMSGDDPTAFKAIRFFLQSRSPDFAEKTRLEVSTVDEKTLLEDIRRDIYGIREDAPREPPPPPPDAADAPDTTPAAGEPLPHQTLGDPDAEQQANHGESRKTQENDGFEEGDITAIRL